MIALPLLLLGLSPPTVDAQPPTFAGPSNAPAASESLGDDSIASQSTSAGTEVPLADELSSIVYDGSVPQSIEQLRQLEQQQRKVAEAAEACAVSVQIGPAQGAGVIISESGYILTAAHVAMRPGKTATITLSDGRRLLATTLGMNRSVDAGLMKINENQNDGEPFPHATLGSSADLRPGMWCVATGHPGGYDGGRGPVTRVGRILAVSDQALVTDCALVGGDSGGPLFDLSGRLIAVHSRIGNDVADNLHVPIDRYDESWDRMQTGEAWGYLPGFRPIIGVTGSKSAEKAIIEAVAAGSPAANAGIEPGDVIEQFGEVVITDFDSLKRAVADTMPGERLKVWVDRNGETVGFSLEIGRAQ